MVGLNPFVISELVTSVLCKTQKYIDRDVIYNEIGGDGGGGGGGGGKYSDSNVMHFNNYMLRHNYAQI